MGMINKILSKLNMILAIAAFIVLFNSCNGQATENCKSSYKKARTNLSAYYMNNALPLLEEALNNVEQAMKCDETRHGAIEMKLSLLMLLKQYEHGYKYVDSLDENDFKVDYKKKMWHNYFLALDYESKSDTVNRNKSYAEIIPAIENYIQSENKSEFNEEAYYDLFFIKAKVSDQKQINAEIEKLEQQYPFEKDFLDGVKTTLFNISGQTNVIQIN